MSVMAPPIIETLARVRMAIVLLLTAVGLGAAETLLVAGQAVLAGGFGAIAVEVGVRAAVYAALAWLVLRLRRGANGVRITVAIVLGGFGTLSMVVAPIAWLTGGGSVPEFLGEASAMTLLFTAMRTLHVVAVIGGVAMLFGPGAGPFFRRG